LDSPHPTEASLKISQQNEDGEGQVYKLVRVLFFIGQFAKFSNTFFRVHGGLADSESV
jgi:hypothetical protein